MTSSPPSSISSFSPALNVLSNINPLVCKSVVKDQSALGIPPISSPPRKSSPLPPAKVSAPSPPSSISRDEDPISRSSPLPASSQSWKLAPFLGDVDIIKSSSVVSTSAYNSSSPSLEMRISAPTPPTKVSSPTPPVNVSSPLPPSSLSSPPCRDVNSSSPPSPNKLSFPGVSNNLFSRSGSATPGMTISLPQSSRPT